MIPVDFIKKYEKTILISIILIGIAIRLGLIFTVQEPVNKDAEQYYKIAFNMLDGKGVSIDGINPTARRSPGYPFILATIMSIAGRNPDALYIFQSCVNIFTIILVYFSLKYFKVIFPVRIIITSLFTFSTSFVFINVLYAEIITMFFVALLLYISVMPQLKEKPIFKSILIGLIIGFLIHLRPPFLYFPVFLILAIPFARYILKKQGTLEFAIISITTIFVIFPWTIRNKVVFDRWIPLVSAGGNEIWRANVEIPYRTVWYSVTDIQKYEDQRTESSGIQNKLISDFRNQYNLSDSEDLNRFLSKQAKSNILQHPFRYALLCVNRFLLFWFSPPWLRSSCWSSTEMESSGSTV